MVARGVGGVIVFPQHGCQMNRTRATLKALPAPHRPPSPLRPPPPVGEASDILLHRRATQASPPNPTLPPPLQTVRLSFLYS